MNYTAVWSCSWPPCPCCPVWRVSGGGAWAGSVAETGCCQVPVAGEFKITSCKSTFHPQQVTFAASTCTKCAKLLRLPPSRVWLAICANKQTFLPHQVVGESTALTSKQSAGYWATTGALSFFFFLWQATQMCFVFFSILCPCSLLKVQ